MASCLESQGFSLSIGEEYGYSFGFSTTGVAYTFANSQQKAREVAEARVGDGGWREKTGFGKVFKLVLL